LRFTVLLLRRRRFFPRAFFAENSFMDSFGLFLSSVNFFSLVFFIAYSGDFDERNVYKSTRPINQFSRTRLGCWTCDDRFTGNPRERGDSHREVFVYTVVSTDKNRKVRKTVQRFGKLFYVFKNYNSS